MVVQVWLIIVSDARKFDVVVRVSLVVFSESVVQHS